MSVNEVFPGIKNAHVASCGTPPFVEWDSMKYRGYFENHHGDQFIFWWDGGDTAYFAGGDLEWDNVYAIHLEDGIYPPGVCLTGKELTWLKTCFSIVAERGA